MRVSFAVLVAPFFLLSCAAPEAYMATTPSNRPEVSFPGLSPAAVRNKLTSLCAAHGLLVQASSQSMVKCGREIPGGVGIITQELIGNVDSTAPEQFIRFAIFKAGGATRVQAYQWIQTQMAFGQIRKLELNSGRQFNSVMRKLIAIGGKPVTTG